MRLIKADSPETNHNKMLLRSNIQQLERSLPLLLKMLKIIGAKDLIGRIEQQLIKPIKSEQWQLAKDNADKIITLMGAFSSSSMKEASFYVIQIRSILSLIIEIEYRINNPTAAKYDEELFGGELDEDESDDYYWEQI